MSKNGFRYLFIFVLPVVLASCAYPIASEYRNEAKPDLTFAMVNKNPDAYKGNVVIWGGVVIKVVNTENGSEMYVLETPLTSGERPESSDYSEGRFIADSASYIDPLVYRKDRRVTVAGVIEGSKKVPDETNKNFSYIYPVIEIKQVVVWKREYQYPYYYPYSPYYNPDWDYWEYGPYWGWGVGGVFEFEGGRHGHGHGHGGEHGGGGFEGGGGERGGGGHGGGGGGFGGHGGGGGGGGGGHR